MLSGRPKVLIVDDDDNIVLALHRVLYQDNDCYDVLLARSAEIAQQILADTRVTVLVTDVHLPERSGMDLLSWVAVQAPSTRVIVMTSFDIGGIKDRAHAFGCLRLVPKPFDAHEMRAAVLRALALRDSFTGNLSELSFVDVIQMLCIARKSTALRLSDGASAGVVHIESGEPVHAVWDDLVGEEAFFRMLGVKNGLFYAAPLPPDLERTLHRGWQYLMIEGLRRLDEENGRPGDAVSEGDRSSLHLLPDSVPPPPISAPASAPAVTLSRSTVGSMLRGRTLGESRADLAAPPRPEVTRLIDGGFSALRAGRRDEARRAWEEALRLEPHNRMLELNLRKLGAAGSSPPASFTATRETG